jgi:hypothetical protein
MKWIWVFLIFTACSKSTSKKEIEKNKLIPEDNHVYEYNWYKPISEYNQKRIELHGFVWFDSISPFLHNGTYEVYERPNCYDCNPINIITETDLSIVQVSDSTYVPDSISPQWRLVKIIGKVESYDFIKPERFEQAEYSYPDYENSGYSQVTNQLIDEKPYDDQKVYIDGYVKVPRVTVGDDYLLLEVSGSGIKREITIYIKTGSKANEVEKLPRSYTINDFKFRDQYGKLVKGKKVRLYGIWKNYMDNEIDDAGIIYVEVIKIL